MKSDKIKKKELREEIKEYVDEIDCYEDLKEIRNILKNKSRKTLEEYVNKYFPSYNIEVKKAFILEVRKIWTQVWKEIKDKNPEEIDYFCEIEIDGHYLDIWIDYCIGCLFNPRDLAIVIFKIFKGEIFL